MLTKLIFYYSYFQLNSFKCPFWEWQGIISLTKVSRLSTCPSFSLVRKLLPRVKAEKPALVLPLMQKNRSFSFNLAENSIFNTSRSHNKGKLKITLVDKTIISCNISVLGVHFWITPGFIQLQLVWRSTTAKIFSLMFIYYNLVFLALFILLHCVWALELPWNQYCIAVRKGNSWRKLQSNVPIYNGKYLRAICQRKLVMLLSPYISHLSW